MGRSSFSDVLLVAAVAVPSAGLAACLTVWFARPVGSPGALPSVALRQDEVLRNDEAILRRLDELERTMLRPHALEPEVRREPTDARSIDLERLEELLGRLESVAAAGSQLARARTSLDVSSVPRSMPANLPEVTAFHAMGTQDHEAAQRSVVLLTMPEVATRFGFPDKAEVSNGGFYWVYHLGSPGQPTGSISFNFVNGRVGWIEVSSY